MFEQDYLMRMIMQLIEAIVRSMRLAEGEEKDPAAAADLLEKAIGQATELDGATLLSLSPDSIAGILQVSGTDPKVAEYVGRTMSLEAHYLRLSANDDVAALREQQADALASAFGFDIDDTVPADAAMQAFLDAEQAERDRTSADDTDDADADDDGRA